MELESEACWRVVGLERGLGQSSKARLHFWLAQRKSFTRNYPGLFWGKAVMSLFKAWQGFDSLLSCSPFENGKNKTFIFHSKRYVYIWWSHFRLQGSAISRWDNRIHLPMNQISCVHCTSVRQPRPVTQVWMNSLTLPTSLPSLDGYHCFLGSSFPQEYPT